MKVNPYAVERLRVRLKDQRAAMRDLSDQLEENGAEMAAAALAFAARMRGLDDALELVDQWEREEERRRSGQQSLASAAIDLMKQGIPPSEASRLTGCLLNTVYVTAARRRAAGEAIPKFTARRHPKAIEEKAS